MDTLLLRLTETDSAEWVENGHLRRDRLEATAEVRHGRRLTVLVPGRDVLLVRADIPSRRRSEIERALPYALEEWLVEPPETQHFAWQQTETDVAAAVVARDRLDGWLERLSAAGLAPDALLPETLALPWREGEWSLLLAGEDAWLRTGQFSGQACDREVLPAVVEALWAELSEADRPRCLRLWCVDGVPPEEQFSMPVESEPAPESVLSVFEPTADTLDLLVGDYAPRTRLSERFGPWRAAAVAAAVFLISVFALQAVEYYRLDREVAALQGQIDAVFHRAVPGVTRIVNARVQMQQALDALNAGDDGADLFALLDRSASILAKSPGLQITQLTYRDGRIDLALTAPDIGAFETLKSELSKRGLKVELGSVSSQGGVSQGQLSLQRGGA